MEGCSLLSGAWGKYSLLPGAAGSPDSPGQKFSAVEGAPRSLVLDQTG